MAEIPTTTTYTLNELFTEEVPLHFADKELADIIKGFEMALAPIKEEAPKIEKPQIGLPTIKRAYKKRKSVDTIQKPKGLMKKVKKQEKDQREEVKKSCDNENKMKNDIEYLKKQLLEITNFTKEMHDRYSLLAAKLDGKSTHDNIQRTIP